MKKSVILLMSIMVLAVLAVWTPNTEAYNNFNGGCDNCHGAFLSGSYVSNTAQDGAAWGMNLHDGHRNTMLSGNCIACHVTGDFNNPPLGGPSGDGFDSCVGCHGRDDDLNNGQIGAALRQHHENANAATCGGCHSDNLPASFTPVGENVSPARYTARSIDPCNDTVFGVFGSDNDGDLKYDGNDADCWDEISVDFGALGLWNFNAGVDNQLNNENVEYVAVYNNKLAVDFGSSLGLWEYDGTSWSHLTSSDPDNSGNTMVAYDGGLAVDLGPLGLWHFTAAGAWNKLNSQNVEYLAVYNNKLAVDFGSSSGLWEYDGTSWSHLTSSDPDNSGNTMVAYDGGLAVDLGPLGLWHFTAAGAWNQLNSQNVEYLVVSANKLAVDFGSSSGLWEYDGTSWSHLTKADPDNSGNTMVGVNLQ